MPELEYVEARRALLDALEALRQHLPALVLVGAQAVYIHTGDGSLGIAPFTTDGDVALDPGILGVDQRISDAMTSGGFMATQQPGIWASHRGVTVDLLVPQSLSGGGARGARLGVHGKRAAHKVKGLEACLVDKAPRILGALDATDARQVEVAVAGPAALIVSKTHKIADRTTGNVRVKDKDALDVLRLLQEVPLSDTLRGFTILRKTELSAEVTEQAISRMRELFMRPSDPGSEMAARAVGLLGDPDQVRLSTSLLASELLSGLS